MQMVHEKPDAIEWTDARGCKRRNDVCAAFKRDDKWYYVVEVRDDTDLGPDKRFLIVPWSEITYFLHFA